MTDLIRKHIKSILIDCIYFWLNACVCHIPFWSIRRVFYVLLGMRIGRDSRILMNCRVIEPWRILIGSNTIVNEDCVLDGRGELKIGDNTTIAIGSKLITGYHNIDSDLFEYRTEPIIIGDNCVLFAGCICVAGVTINKGCVFSAGTVINRGHYPDNTVYAGNPAKRMRNRVISNEYNPAVWKPWFR